jgi:hypothetical protein
MSASHQPGGRLVSLERCDYLLPTIVFCRSADTAMAKKEYMFPFATVVECPQAEMLDGIGSTLVATGLTNDPAFRRALLDAEHIDRLNLGPIPRPDSTGSSRTKATSSISCIAPARFRWRRTVSQRKTHFNGASDVTNRHAEA